MRWRVSSALILGSSLGWGDEHQKAAGVSGEEREALRGTNLMCNIRPRLADVAPHPAHDANVLVAVEQGVLLIPGHGADPTRTRGGPNRRVMVSAGPESLEAALREDDDEALGALVRRRYGHMLGGDQLGQHRWR